MTSTILYWLQIGVYFLLAYSVFVFIRSIYRRKYFIPRNKKEWNNLLGDLFTFTAAIFILFILEKNYRNPLESVQQYRHKPLPAFSFYNIKKARQESLNDYRGKLILVNIWATWCGPCRREMPDLNRLYVEYHIKGLEVLAISDENINTINKYLSEHSFEFVTGNFMQINSPLAQIGTRPVSFLVDQKGNVIDVLVGSRGYKFFKGWVKKYIE